jgi:malate dehydrogenase (oxaloacetate-decarboxylating)
MRPAYELAHRPADRGKDCGCVSVDFTYRIQMPHRAGQLAKLTGAIADCDGLIGDITTESVTREGSVRQLTVEVEGQEHAQRLADKLGELDEVEVEWFRDRALWVHRGGKLTIEPTRKVENVQDMRDVYTPGVARACEAIKADPAAAALYTMIGHSVAICTNGTRVLGLGDVGPLAAMPVMEGKAVFYRQLAGISAMPILVDADDVDGFVETVTRIAPTFGGIHLEDIRAPDCFEIEKRLGDELDQPVMHDDVHGTAVVALAAAMVASRQAGLELPKATVGQIGLGAAGWGIASLMVDGGAGRVLGADPDERTHEKARESGIEIVEVGELMREADVVVATTGRPGFIEPDMIRDGQIIFALTNPEPEIEPRAAREAGAVLAFDGASVNNVLGYPGIFKGALRARADCVNTQMKLAAAWAIAGLSIESEKLVPDVLDPDVHEHVATAVCRAAIDSGAGREGDPPPGL